MGQILPDRFETFLWHGDTFDLPASTLRIASSAAFYNQGFLWERALALQFQLEVRAGLGAARLPVAMRTRS